MTTGLFKRKSKKNLRKLTISAPLNQPKDEILTDQKSSEPSIILVTKYTFQKENDNEISVKPNQYFKFIEKLGNGWLKVKSVEQNGVEGLVPASYLDIAINDPKKPVTLKWLHEYKSKTLFTMVVDQVFQNNKTRHIWYKIKLKMHDEYVFIGRTYQQIYEFHTKLEEGPHFELPILPSPITRSSIYHSPNIKFDTNYLSSLKQMKLDLTNYFHDLLQFDIDSELYDFVFNSEFFKTENENISNEQFLMKIASDSTLINLNVSSSTYSTTAPLPSVQNENKKTYHKPTTVNKYSTYNMKRSLPQSTSLNTLSSYTSLIDGYNFEEDMDRSQRSNSEKSNSLHSDSIFDSCESYSTTPLTMNTSVFKNSSYNDSRIDEIDELK